MSKKTILLFGFIIAKFVIQYSIIDPGYDLQRDEYLHLEQSSHLAWGYMSVPPFTSWTSYCIALLGNGVFWVKFFPTLFGALTIVVVWKVIEALNGSLFALVMGATAMLLSVLLRLNVLYQPNTPDVFFWTIFYFFVLRYIQSEHPKWLYAAAIIFALGFLNKYNFVFLLLGLLPAILITHHRKIFGNRHFYFAILLGSILVLPNLFWQFQNHFPVFHHLDELTRTQLVNVNRTDFLREQIIYFIGSLFVLIIAFITLIKNKQYKNYQVFLWAFVFTMLLYVYLKAKPYYAIGLYPFFIAVGSARLGEILQEGWKRYLQPVAIILPVIISIPLFMVAFPNKSPQEIAAHPNRYKALGLLRWEDGKDHAVPQDFADMLGWKELATKVENNYMQLPATEHTLILCDNYGEAGAINYYVKNKNIKAVSFNADYVNWFDFSKRTDNLIRVKSASGKASEMEKTAPFFETGIAADSITNSFAREYGTTVFVFRHAKIDVNERLKNEVDKAKHY